MNVIRDGRCRLAGVLVLAMVGVARAGGCPEDVGGDGSVGFGDVLAVLGAWGPCVACPEDVDGNGTVGFSDILAVLTAWGPCPVVPGGACCLGDGTCTVETEADCAAAGGRFVARADCTDTDADRIPDVFERDDCGPVMGCTTGTDPFDADTDGDGIADGDEAFGTAEGLRLNQMGADPLRRDIFVEADWMDDTTGGSHSHRPTANVVATVATAFGNAPLVNPCGGQGIELHVDYGQGGLFAGGNLIGDDTVVVFDSEFNLYKAEHFDPRRQGYFHYAIYCHWYNAAGNTSSGVAELPGDDFIVSLYDAATNYNVAHATMHELGHNLNLRHGGFENRNYKPNYNSVMNYRFDFEGNDADCDGFGEFTLDYSHGTNVLVDENAIDEAAGVCGGVWIDWNGNAVVDPPYARNVNCEAGITDACGGDAGGNCHDSTCGMLFDHDDWANLLLPIPPTDGPGAVEIVTCGDVDGAP